MKCPYCESEKTEVIHTEKYETCVIRYRKCVSCHMPFKTEETIIIYQIETSSK
jgi:transcriptional regulator NrdR family protein